MSLIRVIPQLGPDVKSARLCEHLWQPSAHGFGDLYCSNCRNFGAYSEDERDRPLEWWRSRIKELRVKRLNDKETPAI
jgi:hypothetical protein